MMEDATFCVGSEDTLDDAIDTDEHLELATEAAGESGPKEEEGLDGAHASIAERGTGGTEGRGLL